MMSRRDKYIKVSSKLIKLAEELMEDAEEKEKLKKVKISYHTEYDNVRDVEYVYGVVECPYCGYENDGVFQEGGKYPSLLDDVCEHMRFVEEGYAYFSKKERPMIFPSVRY